MYSFQGLLKEEGKDKYGDAYDTWKADPANFEIDDHFPVRELWERGAQCWNTILKAEGTDVLVVAHNAVIQSMVAIALGLGPDYFRRLVQSNCGLTTFAIKPSGAIILQQLNQTPALPLKGNVDKAQNRALLICTSGDENEADNVEIADAISRALGDECVESVLCDDAESSSSLAHDVTAMLWQEKSTQSSCFLSEHLYKLQSAGTTVMFAESRTIDFVVAGALQIEEGLRSRLQLSRGGITVVDFVGGDETGNVANNNASIVCLNYTGHLSELG